MTLVLILWYVLKHGVATRRQTPYQRGVYEHVSQEMLIKSTYSNYD